MKISTILTVTALAAFGIAAGCSTATQSADVSASVRTSLDQAGYKGVTSTQDRVDVRMGRAVESPDGRRAAVEFWVRMLNSGEEVTLVGILFLRFSEDGRCEDLRETWIFEAGDHPPHEGWGT